MSLMRFARLAGPMALAITLGVVSAASAQQEKPAAAKPAAAKQAQVKPAHTAAVTAGDAQPSLLGQYGDWGAYTANPGGKKVCFTLAKPKSSSEDGCALSLPLWSSAEACWSLVGSLPSVTSASWLAPSRQ